MLTQERLKELLHYDPETGVFTRRVVNIHACAKVGDRAGSHTGTIGVDGTVYTIFRLSWFYIHGVWPTHKRHGRKNGPSVGTAFHPRRNKWAARIDINCKTKHLGYYDTQAEAHRAYLKALKEIT